MGFFFHFECHYIQLQPVAALAFLFPGNMHSTSAFKRVFCFTKILGTKLYEKIIKNREEKTINRSILNSLNILYDSEIKLHIAHIENYLY